MHNAFDFLAVELIDGARMNDSSSAAQTAASPYLGLPTFGHLHAKAQWHDAGLTWLDDQGDRRYQVKTGVAGVSFLGELGLGVGEFDFDLGNINTTITAF